MMRPASFCVVAFGLLLSAGPLAVAGDAPSASKAQIQCCRTTKSGGVCQLKTKSACQNSSGIDMGPGTCNPNPCAGATTTTSTTSTTTTSTTTTTTITSTTTTSTTTSTTTTSMPPGFVPTGAMLDARTAHIATRLPDGRVLVAGGTNSAGRLAAAELYDPMSGGFACVGGANATPPPNCMSVMMSARSSFAASPLSDTDVLLTGGVGATGLTTATAELFDPSTGTFLATGSMNDARKQHTATRLAGGQVLVAGGSQTVPSINSAEVYDPATGTFTCVGGMNPSAPPNCSASMTTARNDHTATLLPDGKVLIAGGSDSNGFSLATAELYDAASGTFTPTGSMTSARQGHTATLLPNGRVLMTGGLNAALLVEASAELYDPSTGRFTTTSLVPCGAPPPGTPAGCMTVPRLFHTATALADGGVLFAGGLSSTTTVNDTAEVYDPAANTFTATGNMAIARVRHTATLLSNGSVLVAGGEPNASGQSGAVSSAELFQP